MTEYTQVVNKQFAAADLYLSKGDSYMQNAITSIAQYQYPGYSGSTNVDIPNTFPADINLAAIERITTSAYPATYVFDSSGLFIENPPEGTVGAFTTPAPTINSAEIDAYLAQFAYPEMTTIAMPVLNEYVIRPVPTINLPEFNPVTEIGSINEPTNQQHVLISEHERLRDDVRDWVDTKAAEWYAIYCPGINDLLSVATAKLSQVISDGTMLRADYIDLLRTKSRTSVEANKQAAIKEINNDRRRAGFNSLPQSVSAGLLKVSLNAHSNLASQDVEREIKVIEMETVNIQWAVTQALGLQNQLMNAFLHYTDTIAAISSTAHSHAAVYCEMYNRYYEQLLKRLNYYLDALKTEAAIYDTQLKAALSALDGYKLELEAMDMLGKVDDRRLDFVGKQVQINLAKSQIYIEGLKSVESRANLKISQVKLFGDQVTAHNLQLEGDKLRAEIFLSGQAGNMNKLKAKEIELDANIKTIESINKKTATEIAVGAFEQDNQKILMTQFGYKLDLLKTIYEKARLELNQQQVNAERFNESERYRTESLNRHYEVVARLYESAAKMWEGTGASFGNAINSAVASSV